MALPTLIPSSFQRPLRCTVSLLLLLSTFWHPAIASKGLVAPQPKATPHDLPLPLDGISPRPTKAPEHPLEAFDAEHGIPRELRRRQANYQFPPPVNWCGFVDGAYSDPLSCSVDLTCVNSGAALGCCTATTGICTALYTTCYNFGASCDAACEADPAIRKCSNSNFPWCGTYAFFGGTHLYNCQSVSLGIATVEFLNDFYVTAIGSTLAAATSDILGITASVTLPASASASTIAPSTSSSGPSSGGSGGSLSKGAIAGVAIGAVIGGLLLISLVAFGCFFLLRNRRRRQEAGGPTGPQPSMPPPMIQQHQAGALPAKTGYDHYAPVPEPQPQPQPQPASTHASTVPAPSVSPVSASVAGTHTGSEGFAPPPPSMTPPPPFSAGGTVGTNSMISSSDVGRGSYYQAPASPNTHEVDGTLGNPGVPPGQGTGRSEVDATMGNPGVPAGGHGIQNQLVPGGSPSATEVEGHQANLRGPFEMPGHS